MVESLAKVALFKGNPATQILVQLTANGEGLVNGVHAQNLVVEERRRDIDKKQEMLNTEDCHVLEMQLKHRLATLQFAVRK